MKIAAAFLLTFFPNVVFSQETAVQTVTTVNPSNQVTKVVRVRYGYAKTIAELAALGGPVSVNADNTLKVIVLHGRANDVAAAEQTIHELDVPAAAQASSATAQALKNKDIELIVSVIGGSDKTELLSGGQMPEAMVPVIKQLRAIFPYKNYQLLSSMLLRSSEGARAGSRGSLVNFENNSRLNDYIVEYGEVRMSTEESKPSIHLQRFKFETNVTVSLTTAPNITQLQTVPVTIETDIDLREGQKVVAGKANIGSSNLALFVVLAARLID